MNCRFRRWAAGLLTAALGASPSVAQTYATPLPPGPGFVGLPIPAGPMVAPVFLPVGAPTAAPVAVYHYPGSVPASDCSTISSYTPTSSGCGTHWSLTGEFLYWFGQTSTLPPLVSAAGPGIAVPPGAALGRPDTDVLFGGGRTDTAARPGARFSLDYALSDQAGVVSRFFFLGDSSDRFDGSSRPGGVTLGRPAVFAPAGLPTALPVATASGLATTRLLGWDIDYRQRLDCGDGAQLDLLVGYRYLHLGDRVDVSSSTPFPLIGIGVAGVGVVSDSIRTRNNFHGPQIGLSLRRQLRAGWSMDALVKLALGVTVARADLDGSTVVGAAGLPVGLLVGPANTVHGQNSFFAAVPEASLGFGYQACENLRLTAGYTLLYWSRVRRAADQIDLSAGTADRPAFRDVTGDYWAQGVRFGAEWRF